MTKERYNEKIHALIGKLFYKEKYYRNPKEKGEFFWGLLQNIDFKVSKVRRTDA